MRPEDIGTYYESILEKEVRKEGGIYYTPPLIVDYMVANSLGELLKGKAPAKAAKIRIVDPACGGGIFLLGAYQHLLDWHEKHVGKLTLEQRQNLRHRAEKFYACTKNRATPCTIRLLTVQCMHVRVLRSSIHANP